MAIANDTFVEALDTALELHTPTGPNAGSGWSIAAGSMTVLAATDEVRGNAGGARYQMDDDLGFDEMDVAGDFDFTAATVPGGAALTSGPTGRAPTPPGIATIAFFYAWNTGIMFGSWIINDGISADTLEEDWGAPTTPKTLYLQVRNNDHRGFADGVEKVALITNNGVGNVRGGLRLTNFSATEFPFADNYLSEGIAPPPPPPVDNPFPEYGQGRAAIGDPSVYGATIVRS